MGGGFGSKFDIDTWGIACAKLSKQTGRPVKLMLDRDEEQLMAGSRPSFYGNIKVAAKKDGTLTGYESETWSTGGPSGRGSPPLPYVFDPKNNKTRHINISTNTGPSRAWRAPNHPQSAVLTMCALTDLAGKLDMDPLEFFKKNAGLTAAPRGVPGATRQGRRADRLEGANSISPAKARATCAAASAFRCTPGAGARTTANAA